MRAAELTRPANADLDRRIDTLEQDLDAVEQTLADATAAALDYLATVSETTVEAEMERRVVSVLFGRWQRVAEIDTKGVVLLAKYLGFIAEDLAKITDTRDATLTDSPRFEADTETTDNNVNQKAEPISFPYDKRLWLPEKTPESIPHDAILLEIDQDSGVIRYGDRTIAITWHSEIKAFNAIVSQLDKGKFFSRYDIAHIYGGFWAIDALYHHTLSALRQRFIEELKVTLFEQDTQESPYTQYLPNPQLVVVAQGVQIPRRIQPTKQVITLSAQSQETSKAPEGDSLAQNQSQSTRGSSKKRPATRSTTANPASRSSQLTGTQTGKKPRRSAVTRSVPMGPPDVHAWAAEGAVGRTEYMKDYDSPPDTTVKESENERALRLHKESRRSGGMVAIVGLPGTKEVWKQQANCLGAHPDLFFPERGASTREAKEVCRGCAVMQDCLEYALDNGEKFGIWGGMSERERRRIRRRRAMQKRSALLNQNTAS